MLSLGKSTSETFIIIYVNLIADIIHSQTDIYNGVSNKNLGESFLLIWKLVDLETFDGDMEKDITENNDIADLAIMGILKIYAKVNSYTHIKEYDDNEYLQEQLPD